VAVGSAYSTSAIWAGLTLAALGPAATVPTARWIFCFDTVVLFTLIPLLMARRREPRKGRRDGGVSILKGIFRIPSSSPPWLASARGDRIPPAGIHDRS
jgi:hypothetical protein